MSYRRKLGETYEEFGADYLELEEARTVEIELTIGEISESGSYTVMKYNGEWYIQPSAI